MEYFGFVTGLLYLVWEIRQNNLMWVVGIQSALAYAFVFAQSGLYAAMGFQIYYFVVSIYGLVCWRRDKRKAADMQASASADATADALSGQILYRMITPKLLLLSGVVAVAVFLFIYVVLEQFTGDPMPVADAVVATLGIVATYWLGKAYLHQWLLWVGVNILSVWMFFEQQLYVTAILYVLYTASAIYGFAHWKRKGVKISV